MNTAKAIYKLVKSQTPTVDYVQLVPDIKVDIDKLIEEFKVVEHRLFSNSIMQKKCWVLDRGKEAEEFSTMSYLQEIIPLIKNLCFFNSIYFRIVMPNTCYNWHRDTMKMCVHIPLITNIGCKFVYDDAVFTMPADGSVYLVNNEKMHTFINAGPTPRLHVTFDIL